MNKIVFKAVIFVFIVFSFSFGLETQLFAQSVKYSNPDLKILTELRNNLKAGTPEQKEEVLNIFMERHNVELIPNVIEAILDDTISPRHGDTGWSNVYHQAATALCQFAYKIDGITQKERGFKEYSFYEDAGTASDQRRKEVYNNWLNWWSKNQTKILEYSTSKH